MKQILAQAVWLSRHFVQIMNLSGLKMSKNCETGFLKFRYQEVLITGPDCAWVFCQMLRGQEFFSVKNTLYFDKFVYLLTNSLCCSLAVEPYLKTVLE